ncbi:hypothetical protein OB13_17030 [Pontibacter sp. HJ8]
MKIFLTFGILFLLQLSVCAQDKIVKVTGDEIKARILEITLHEVLYQYPDSLQGIARRLPKGEVFMIQFENGSKEVFEQNLPDSPANLHSAWSPEMMQSLGREDALKYYKGNGAMWGSAASSLIMFPIGLAGSLVIGATPPRTENFRVSDTHLLSYTDYVQGYQKQAHKRKKNKALAGVGIGVGIQLTLVMLVLAAYR